LSSKQTRKTIRETNKHGASQNLRALSEAADQWQCFDDAIKSQIVTDLTKKIASSLIL